jgi:hypothetical protein
MSDFKRKNDYSVTVFFNGEKRLFTEYVHNMFNYKKWLIMKGISFDYLLVYVRRSRVPLCYYSFEDFIEPFPDFSRRGQFKKGW